MQIEHTATTLLCT